MQRALAQLLRAEEDERERIATDLHDDTIQVMVATLYSLDRAQRGAAALPEDTVARIRAARETLEDAIGRARGLAFELRPPLLEAQGLGAAVRALAAYRASEAGFGCRVTATAKRFPAATEMLAYRCIAEALANTAKHARAETVTVRIGYRRGRLTIEVRDDGRGFRADRPLPAPGRSSISGWGCSRSGCGWPTGTSRSRRRPERARGWPSRCRRRSAACKGALARPTGH